MKAVKGNKEYAIEESQMKAYQDAGFDIVEGETVVAHGRGKTVPYEEYAALKEELAVLRQATGQADEEVAGILTAYAGEHDINLGKATTVSGIMKKIKEHAAGGADV